MKNLNINAILLKDRPAKNPNFPVNVGAAAKLNTLYGEMDRAAERKGGLPQFTIEDCCRLGIWYQQAWGALPTVARLKALYNMPNYYTIVDLFGDVIKYHVAINRYALNQPIAEETK